MGEDITNADDKVTEAEPLNTDPQPTGIDLSDLNRMLQIMDIATQRGAFRGSELSQVGATYDKISSFLRYLQEQQPQQPKEEKEEDENA